MHETVLGALCAYVLIGLLFASYLAVHELLDEPFFAQSGPHSQSEYLYFSFVALTTLGFGDLSPAVASSGTDRARGPRRSDLPGDDGREARDALGASERQRLGVQGAAAAPLVV